MGEDEQGPSGEERRGFGRDREAHRERFDEMASTFKQGEFTVDNKDGSWTKYTTYEQSFDPLDQKEIAWLTEFRLRAAAAGMKEAFAPLVISTQAMVYPSREAVAADPLSGRRGLTFVQLGYELPAAPPHNAPRKDH